MATTVQTPAAKAPPKGTPMSSTRKTALVAGIFYLITFISIPTLALYGPVKNHQDWILSSGGHTGVLVGGFLEVIVALAGIGTAVTLYPVVKRQNEGVALGFAAARVLEASMIFAGVVSLLSLVTLRQDLGGAAGANTAALVTTGASHVAVYNWTFLLSQSLMPAINALLLGSLMYRSRLVPRIIPVVGLIGAPFLICTVIATLFGGIKLGSPEARRSPGGCLGAVAGRVAGRQGLQALPDHRRNGRRCQHAARLPGRRGLTPGRTTRPGPPQGPAVSAQAARCGCRWPCCTDAGPHRTRRTGRIATAPMIAHSPATVYSTP